MITRIPKANVVLRELCCSAVKTGVFKIVKLAVFKSVFISTLICGHEPCVTSEIILSQEQAVEMGFLRKVQGMTLCDKVHRFEIREPRNVKSLLRIERFHAAWVQPCVQNLPRKISKASFAG